MAALALQRNSVQRTHFNADAVLPYGLRLTDFESAMQDVYGTDGVEVKSTRKVGGAVDTHGARDQWMCVFVYRVDNKSEPAVARGPLTFTEAYLGQVAKDDFRKNPRSELGTRTATLHKSGIQKLRKNWIYRL